MCCRTEGASFPNIAVCLFVQFALANTYYRNVTAFACFPDDLAKELSFGCMNQRVRG